MIGEWEARVVSSSAHRHRRRQDESGKDTPKTNHDAKKVRLLTLWSIFRQSRKAETHSRTRAFIVLLYYLVLSATVVQAGGNTVGRAFLLIQSDTQNKILYTTLPNFDESVANSQEEEVLTTAEPLVDDLDKPRGMALWSDGMEHWLYVYDGTSQDLVKYQLSISGDTLAAARVSEPVVQGLDIGGLAIDNAKNLYYIGPTGGSLTKIPFDDRTAKVELFANNFNINAAKSLVTDALYVFWANGATGKASGSAVKAPTKLLPATQTTYPVQLSKNAVVSNGICLAQGNVFWTSEGTLYVTRKNNTSPFDESKVVNSGFGNAHGCAGDSARGAIYVADETGGAVFELPVNFGDLREIRTPTKLLEVDSPTHLAVLRSSASARRGTLTVLFFSMIAACSVLLA
ncbi:unnamed protein product [Amoebophrya sp. A25]|nr:unnamed protein product [Amoebophrya sp. A25]|eukprot:GSA25T00016089001.1